MADTPREMKPGTPRLVFVSNICPHYRVRTYETLAALYPITFYFFSAGDEWYWQQQHGVRAGKFRYRYLPGIKLGRTRFVFGLVPLLWRESCDVFIKCINGRFALPVTYLIARLRRKPFILWTGIWMRLQTRFHRWAFPLTRYIYTHADAVVTYGEHVKRYLISEGVPPERIFCAHHAIDNARYSRPVSADELQQFRLKLNLDSHQRVVLYLGRLEDNKGVSYLLDAFARLNLPDVVLVIVGEGSEKPSLQAQAARLGLEARVRFCPYVPPEQTPVCYALAYTVIVPSVTVPAGKETWGLVVNEAMNQGVPVIATDAVGAAAGGLVRHGVTGLVVSERDSATLAVAMENLLMSPALRDRLSQQARALMTGWDNGRMVDGFAQAIDYVLGRSATAVALRP